MLWFWLEIHIFIFKIHINLIVGLDRTGHMIDKPVIFHIETCAAGLGEIDVIVVNPNGQTEEV